MDTREFTRRVSEYMKEHHMAEMGDGILAAVSGGADSVCLLLVLKDLADELGIRISAFHLNHGLRGEEAMRDENYVRELCEKQEIPLKVVREDVRQYAAETGMSEEEAGRVLRYTHLARTAEEFRCRKVATAHHCDDNVETVLMNLFRGSGLKGIGGIRPVRELNERSRCCSGTETKSCKGSDSTKCEIIRPLLQISRKEIENYLYKKKVVWCEDSTNGESTYGRNRVRNTLIPWIQEHINDQASAHVLKTAEFAAQADEYFRAEAEKILGERVGLQYASGISTDTFDVQPHIMKTYLVRAMIGRVSESEKDISSRHIEAICALTGPGGGTMVHLPYGLRAVRGYDRLEITRNDEIPVEMSGEKTSSYGQNECSQNRNDLPKLALNQSLKMEIMGLSVEMRVFLAKKEMEIPKNQCTKWFDYDKINEVLCIRTRETGDYYIIGGEKRKLLKRFFIDEKIPEAVRGEIPLLADGNHILWIFGYRISEEYKITNSTQTILEVRIHKGEDYGRKY